ncbi:MAG: electron transport complex subunit RsxA [Pseudomonadales bacterium]|nr:electron transport complex subunit RsxA [Pseudomonadales bacterium]
MQYSAKLETLHPLLDFLGIIVAAALVNNVALVQFLGVSFFIANSNRLQSAIELGMLSFIALFISSALNLILYRWILAPLNLDILRLVLFVMISSAVAFYLVRIVSNYFPLTWRRHELAILLIAGNSAVIGVSLMLSTSIMPLLEALTYSFGAAFGFALVLVGFAALRERLANADIPLPFQGAPIQFLSAAIVAMVLLGFAGLV